MFLFVSLFPNAFHPLIEMNSSKLITDDFLSVPFSFTKIISATGYQSVLTKDKKESLWLLIKEYLPSEISDVKNLFTK